MKLLALLFLFLAASSLSAMTNSPELDLSLEDQVYSARYRYQEAIRKANLLLKSGKMDAAYTFALEEVLKTRVRKENIFKKVLAVLQPTDGSLPSDFPELGKKLATYAEIICDQGEWFYQLVAAAHRDDPVAFNQYCRKMMDQFEILDGMEKELSSRI